MLVIGEPKAFIREEAQDFIDLYASLGERAEIFLPDHILDNLRSFVRLCYEEPDDPAKQQAEINQYILKLKEDIPGYVDAALMLFPHEDSKAFQYSSRKLKFKKRLNAFIDTEALDEDKRQYAINILNTHDFSVGTPPVTQHYIDFMGKILLGDSVRDLRKFRDVIGVTDEIDEAHWNYFMDTLDQMVNQSSHYTTRPEKDDFLHRTEWAVNFKGLNGLIRTVVSGTADTAVELIKGEVFSQDSVKVVDYTSSQALFEQMCEDTTSIFAVKVPHMRKNAFPGQKWFPFLTRLILIDDSPESRSSNTSLVFSFHNKIINTLNKVHTKKLGAPANIQLNIRLILENVNAKYLEEFKYKIEDQLKFYEQELKRIKNEQLGQEDDIDKNIILFKFDEFSRQILKDKYALEKLRDFIFFLENNIDEKKREKQNKELIKEFEERTVAYFYSGNPKTQIATILEGGGRNQIRTYGNYLLQQEFKGISEEIRHKCQVILSIIPDNYKRTLRNHFHKNFGLNLFLEKYQQYITKVDNESDNKGRFRNFLIDLGILDDLLAKPQEEQEIIKKFISNLGNLDKTSIADDVQMIIRDLVSQKNGKPKPYIVYNQQLSWEYKDLFPADRFDINPFEIEIENTTDGRVDYERLLLKLKRIKTTLSLFDDTGSLWDLFSRNLTILINDPANPTGYSDFNKDSLIRFLGFLNSSKITLFLDEAYTDSVKIEYTRIPKWRSTSRYIMNNIYTYSRIRMVSSLSTTKNLGATGNRLGSLIASPKAADVIEYAKELNNPVKGNSNSLYMLNNVIGIAQLAKKLKDETEEQLPKNASRQEIKENIIRFLKQQVKVSEKNISSYQNGNRKVIKRLSHFEGSPLYIFLLEELAALDKLDILGLPDDFKYKDEPFFVYYQRQLIKNLDKFRVNKNFRAESNLRLKYAKEIAKKVLEKTEEKDVSVIDSDGSYLFNLQLKSFSAYNDLILFTKQLAQERGIAVIPYRTGAIRFSLGGYIYGSDHSYEIAKKEFEDAVIIFLKYWNIFKEMRMDPANKEVDTEDLLKKIFKVNSETHFIEIVLDDYQISKHLKRILNTSLKINDIRTLYHAEPEVSGITINTIGDSKNSVIEFSRHIGRCQNVSEFIYSRAFTKLYENLLAQIYKKIPQLKNLDFNTIASRYSKATVLKYISNKLNYQPNHYVLDDPEEENMMREILIEMENLLFSDAKTKVLALPATEGDISGDKMKLEGVNRILKKFIEEILLHFNLPFAKETVEPSRKEIIQATRNKFEELTGISINDFNLNNYVYEYLRDFRNDPRLQKIDISQRNIGYIIDVIAKDVLNAKIDTIDKLLYLYLFKNDNSFVELIISKLEFLNAKVQEVDDEEVKIITENLMIQIAPHEFKDIVQYIIRKKDIKVSEEDLHLVTRKVVLFFIELINKTKGTLYYEKYTHNLIKVVETEFKKQNSSVNEMIQHGITVYTDFEMENKALVEYKNGQLNWINELMSKCGVIASEQAVQIHTRIATDAKKREYPFHKVDRLEPKSKKGIDFSNPNEIVKSLDTRPDSNFFAERLKRFVANMDKHDYRCKIKKTGLVKELVVFQKSYMKYLTDNYRLFLYKDITEKDIKNFVPDIIAFFGAPEKVISYPQVGYFDLDGPNGKIKTIVTPLKQKADYFGNIKKPRLSLINEKVKEMGGIPKHGSLFAVEEEDGSVFVIEIDGDSGVGKSEMLAAMMLKWLRRNLPGIRSIKMIAGDMFHVFKDTEGNIYGIGTEVGDFSRVTDFDPDFIKQYKFLFESSADSNVEDLNSRSTISGMCDISMPYKIDIILTASNYARADAGITRIDNPENFMLYIDSHGERKEKATSQDGPNFQRTLMRYTGDKNIVDVLAKHGNYIDDVLDWDKDIYGNHYLASSYKMIGKIDVIDIVNKIFKGKEFEKDDKLFVIEKVDFDIIKNRFMANALANDESEEINFVIDRTFFSSIFDSLASTPAGQPFISEKDQIKQRHQLIDILKGGSNSKGKGKNIQCGILSTEIGKKGKEITGPQKAAEDLKRLIQEVRILNPEINQNKNHVKKLLNENYEHIFNGNMNSTEIWRYNFYLFQLDKMKKARFTRVDNDKEIDLSQYLEFEKGDPNKEFSPLLVTTNVNYELTCFSETYKELMSLPNYPDFADEFTESADKLYEAEGYSHETISNNMIIQLLLMDDYIDVDDLHRGQITEKVNRETIAAAKKAAETELQRRQAQREKSTVKKQSPKTEKKDSKQKPTSDNKNKKKGNDKNQNKDNEDKS